MRDTRNAPCCWIRGWVALVVVVGLAHAPCALAQMYKCTDANGRTAFSDIPCTTPPGAAGRAGIGKDGVKQEVLRQPTPSPGNTSPEAISAMCAKSEGSKPSDEVINSLPGAQREAVVAVLRGLVASAGVARDRAQQANLQRVTLRVDASRTAIICMPQQRAQLSGGRIDTYTAFRVEPNGRMETLQPSAEPLVTNDANEPVTMASRCSSLVTSCVRSQPKTLASLDPCFEKTPVCPGGRLDPAANCCPQACKDAYRRERAAGTDPQSAFMKVLFGDEAGAASCVPGMPKRG